MASVTGNPLELLGVGDQVDGEDPIVDDGEADDADGLAVGENGAGLAVDDRGLGQVDESGRGRQNVFGDCLRSDDGETSDGASDAYVGAEDDVGVEHGEQTVDVT